MLSVLRLRVLLIKGLILVTLLTFSAGNQICEKESCSLKPCQNFQKSKFTSENASLFIIEAKGRLGNHLIGYTVIKALNKTLNIQPLVGRETREYLSQYFSNISAPAIEDIFCNWRDLPFEGYQNSIHDLVADESLRKGKLLELWPLGYAYGAKICCPGEDLQKYVQEHYSEFRDGLRFLPEFRDYAADLKRKAAVKVGKNVADITFVGIHNRRTDYLDYMKSKFGVTKNPFKKSYFMAAMEYFREEHENVAFFFVSDDMEWGRKRLKALDDRGDLFFVGNGNTEDPKSIGYDLALLGSCNHTVITWGSFSMWAALFSGGEYYTQYGVIVPKQIQEPEKKRKNRRMG